VEPSWIIAICSVAGLLITWTGSIAGAVVWIGKRLDTNKEAIIGLINEKHEENRIRVDAMQAMLIRHDTILDPEFNGSGMVRRTASKQ